MAGEDALDPRIQQIVEEEALRARLARSLVPAKRSWLDENTKWLLASIVLPGSIFLTGQLQERAAQAEAERREERADKERALTQALEAARNNVAAMTALLPALSDPDPNRSGLALIILKQLELAQRGSDKHLTELAAAVQLRIDRLRNSKSETDRESAARQQELLSQATGASPRAAPDTQLASAPPAAAVRQAAEIKPRIVYIQFYADAQRAQAASAQQLLRSEGVGAPGIEKIAADSRARTGNHPARIYYFNDGDLGGAKWLQARLAAAGLGNFAIARSTIAGVPSGQIELWWPKVVVLSE